MKKERDKLSPNVLVTVALLSAFPLSLFALIAKRVATLRERRRDGREMDRKEDYLKCAPPDNGCGGTARAPSDYRPDKIRVEEMRVLVRELSQEEDEEDRPSKHSMDAFERLISETCQRPVVVPDSEHGIRIAWKNAEREVRVMLPDSGEKQAYMFFRMGTHSELDEVSAEVLAKRLEAIS
jgi:hypothetical protein